MPFVLFVGSPSYFNSAWQLNSRPFQRGSQRNSETEPMDAVPLIFHPPVLPEDTLMEVERNTIHTLRTAFTEEHETANLHAKRPVSAFTVLDVFFSQQAHTDALSDLRFTLAFVHCVMELASSKEPGLDAISCPDISFLEQSLVTDQISLLSREWR